MRWTVVVGTALLTLAYGIVAQAQTTVKRESIKPVGDVSGSMTYKEYCSVCHGVSGKGDGPAAASLKVAPADLTLIAKRSGGKFPFAAVKSKISGEQDVVVAAHGTREMPIWGPLFKQVDASNSKAELRLINLVDYLEKMQAK
jgi:mono/diheme cytochrome c family protein